MRLLNRVPETKRSTQDRVDATVDEAVSKSMRNTTISTVPTKAQPKALSHSLPQPFRRLERTAPGRLDSDGGLFFGKAETVQQSYRRIAHQRYKSEQSEHNTFNGLPDVLASPTTTARTFGRTSTPATTIASIYGCDKSQQRRPDTKKGFRHAPGAPLGAVQEAWEPSHKLGLPDLFAEDQKPTYLPAQKAPGSTNPKAVDSKDRMRSSMLNVLKSYDFQDISEFGF
jgi:hypothetical protein